MTTSDTDPQRRPAAVAATASRAVPREPEAAVAPEPSPLILVADDDATFRETTAALLARAGYETAVAVDAPDALRQATQRSPSLLIADLRMPGNEDLALVRQMATQHGAVPIIIVTAYPSMDSAVSSVGTQVVAYLRKPFPLDALLAAVQRALEQARALRVVREANQRSADWRDRAVGMATALARDPEQLESSVGAFVNGTMEQIVRSLMDISHLTDALTHRQVVQSACGLLNCPRHRALVAAVVDSIDVLEATKQAFKSQQLRALRLRMEAVLATDAGEGGLG